ncbi:MAG: neutral/alkaline non-lysosomal ceramidase N-terminal domain-containing protein [Planctomycetes bacterium]|nr:neutral/alkaline non-lysosomal ceramidase N-terminal domain-containing protein [Planctomycetota bacterium]
MRISWWLLSLTICTLPWTRALPAAESGNFKAGVAARVITPPEGLWMAGYAHRNKPAEGKVHDLFVKALALEDPAGARLVLVTSDLIGLPRELSESVAAEVHRRTGLPRDRLLLTASHTHCGPVLRGSLLDMYDLTPDQEKKIAAYTVQLQTRMVETVVAALADLKPARLAMGAGTASFAINRRQQTPKGVIIGENPKGPVDRSVPVLRVQTPEGRLRAVVFGYACHNTTLDFYQWCGDYAGFAQAFIEEKHPGALALFWIGCGADANPTPRGPLEVCRQHGRELAAAVEEVLQRPLTPVHGPTAARYALLSLPLDRVPTREQLQADLSSGERAVPHRAARLLKILDAGGKIADHYPSYPVQVWRFGHDLLWIALGGEVVVDYDLRLKKELHNEPTVWITAYANDVMAYIPSVRVLQEGGYEADTSMVYYGMPARWAPAIEEKIVGKVHDLVQETQPKPGRER